jgi:hypothetical protein
MFNLHVQCGDKTCIRICIKTSADQKHRFYIRYLFDTKFGSGLLVENCSGVLCQGRGIPGAGGGAAPGHGAQLRPGTARHAHDCRAPRRHQNRPGYAKKFMNDTCTRNYRPSFRENKPKTLVLYD